MNFFRELGLNILDRWKRAHFDARSFPEVATGALRERPPSAHVDPMEVVRWVHETPVLVHQADIDIPFGQPPITVFWCERFYIDVLFWVDGTTAIHQHRFSGAFHVMAGSSLQSTYRFVPTRRYSEQLLTGALELQNVELLKQGDVRTIAAGTEFVHALFHLDRPSVSVVVRTPSDSLAGIQYSYSRAGLAFDPFAKMQSTTRKIQTLDLLQKIGHSDFEAMARTTVRGADAFQAFQILTYLMKRFEKPEKYAAFLQSVGPEHGPLLDVMRACAADELRQNFIVSRRQLAKEREHRFFLALLLNLPDQNTIFQMVKSAFPEERPVDVVVRWLGELAKVDAIHAWVRQTAGVRDGEDPRILDVALDAAAIAVARDRLEGIADEAAADPSVAVALRASVLLGPLFERGSAPLPTGNLR